MNTAYAKVCCAGALVLLGNGCSVLGLDDLDIPNCNEDTDLCDTLSKKEGLSNSCFPYYCGEDGRCIRGPRDKDNDTFWDARTCAGAGLGKLLDCDDNTASVNPDSDETCDDIDNDCDHHVDEELRMHLSDKSESRCVRGNWEVISETCPDGYAWCDHSTVRNGCETNITRRDRCNSCDITNCHFACYLGDCEVVTQLSVGANFGCGRTSKGRIACWGRGFEGQLGHGMNSNASVPNLVIGIDDAFMVSAGGEHACAVLNPDRAVRCWGDNRFGQLGAIDGTSEKMVELTSVAQPVPVPGGQLGTTVLSGVKKLSVGKHHSCALLEDHRVICWGRIDAESPGELTTDADPSPPTFVKRRIEEPFYEQVADAVDIATGGEHTCLATRDGSVECWGSNEYGQLGVEPTAEVRRYVTQVDGLSEVTQLAAGEYHTCALARDGVYCWGLNLNDELGHPSNGLDYRPTLVPNLMNVEGIAAGLAVSCARTSEGSAWCWGNNQGGQLAAPEDVKHTPEPGLVVLEGVEDLGLGEFGCALTRGGHVWCWGRNQYGQLGRDTGDSNRPQRSPVEIAALTDKAR